MHILLVFNFLHNYIFWNSSFVVVYNHILRNISAKWLQNYLLSKRPVFKNVTQNIILRDTPVQNAVTFVIYFKIIEGSYIQFNSQGHIKKYPSPRISLWECNPQRSDRLR